MKLRTAVLLALALTGGAVYVIHAELTYNRLIAEAEERTAVVRSLRSAVDSLTEEAVSAAGRVAALEARVRADSVAYARERRELAMELGQARQTAIEVERELRRSLDAGQAVLLDSLTAAWASRERALLEDRALLEERISGLELLRSATAEALEETATALDVCRCALDEAEAALRTYQAATSSRTIVGRAVDALTSKTGLTIIGSAVAIWAVRELVVGDEDGYRRER